MSHFIIEPEVAGQLGPETVMDTSTHPPHVETLQYVFDGWLGDDIVEAFPCFIVTEKLKQAIDRAGLTGFIWDVVVVERSETFTDLYGDRKLPAFHWMKVVGQDGQDDFFIEDNLLVISRRALEVLKTCQIENCDVEER